MVVLLDANGTMPVDTEEEELVRDKLLVRQNNDNKDEAIVGEEEETVEGNDGDKSEEDSDLDMGSVSNSKKEANGFL